MTEPRIEHRTVQVGEVTLHVATCGPVDGPVVLLLHGFPEFWHSWRHQLMALGAAGLRAVAPDQRGYAGSDAPEDVAAYTMPRLVGDVIGLLDHLDAERAVVVGHDWGAPVAWHTALWRPDRVRGVLGLSVPYTPRNRRRPTAALAAAFGPDHYILWFQEPGRADAELAADPRTTFRRLFAATSGAAQDRPPRVTTSFLDALADPVALPYWLSEDDLDAHVAAYAGRGFTGGLSWYRALDRTWEATAAWQGALLTPPARFVAGAHDLAVGRRSADELAAGMRRGMTDLRGVTLLPGCGHWTQQERPDEVTAAVLAFVDELS